MINIGCPCCASTEAKEIRINCQDDYARFAVLKTHPKPYDSYIPVNLHMCLNCGSVYVPKQDISYIVKEHKGEV